jgi:hypothetical protein
MNTISAASPACPEGDCELATGRSSGMEIFLSAWDLQRTNSFSS